MALLKKINIIFLLIFFYFYSLCLKKFLPFSNLLNYLQSFNNKTIINIKYRSILSISYKFFNKVKISNCLNTAMTVYFVMKLCNKNPKFCIGTSCRDSKFISHAWLEIENIIFDTNKQSIGNLKKIIEI